MGRLLLAPFRETIVVAGCLKLFKRKNHNGFLVRCYTLKQLHVQQHNRNKYSKALRPLRLGQTNINHQKIGQPIKLSDTQPYYLQRINPACRKYQIFHVADVTVEQGCTQGS